MIAPPRPPSHDELELLIKEARERQLRRRLLGTACIAIAASLSLSIYAFVRGGSANSVTPANAGRATGPLCRASQLSATAGWQGATQSMLGGAGVTNRSSTVCSLPAGRPAVQIDWQGRSLAVRERNAPTPFGPGKALRVLDPGATATIYLQWWNYCGTAVDLKVPPTVYLRFGYGLVVTAPVSKEWGVPYCNAPKAPSTLFVSGPRTTD
jgi:Domain of unknown function (DUF4232)